ncbi:RagB/SusD family nutrient uptake outer membrane protein [Mariniflexile sp. HMF6888]|uniref:RagB/SusD family nutrient uptake outer membrane protein n=1 Tax=Mariniflexile sp. HMF6888 TaxID=3373086 RepID=UPI0037B68596
MHTKLKTYRWGFISELNTWALLCLTVLMFLIIACTEFVEVDLPKNQLSTEAVLNDPSTVDAALKSIYGKMRTNRINRQMGLYTDELEEGPGYSGLPSPYQNHTLLANDSKVKSIWGSAYNQIYTANLIIEGLENSVTLNLEDRNQFNGEALFIRAYLHLLLVELFGDVPYITTTDYIVNTTVSRMPRVLVYEHIIADLILAQSLLPDTDFSGDHTRPYATAAEAVLARAYLYSEDWALAEAAANNVIAEFGDLLPDLSQVFLKDAASTIWQFKPDAEGENADGDQFIIIGSPITVLSDLLYFAFESGTIFSPGDQRQSGETAWIKEVSTSLGTFRHAYKYKERGLTFSPNGTPSSKEYPIQLRLAEQYLIRGEARAHLGDIPGAQADINAIRNRAGLGNTTASTLEALLEAILQERRVELFTEKGHRWFDLKRMGKAKEVLEPIKPGWRDTDILLPIPESEILLNPNLTQNDGY